MKGQVVHLHTVNYFKWMLRVNEANEGSIKWNEVVHQVNERTDDSEWQWKQKKWKRKTQECIHKWCRMNDKWRMMEDEWQMMKDEWWKMNDNGRTMNTKFTAW